MTFLYLIENEPTILNDSYYFDDETFFKSKQITSHNVLLISLNCQSYNTINLVQLRIFLKQLDCNDACASIITLQDTWSSEIFNVISKYRL